MKEERNSEDLTGQALDAGSMHDRRLIYELSIKYDLRNPDVALELYEQIAADPGYFDSETGQRFTRSLLRTAVHSDNYLEDEKTVSGRTIETVAQTKSKTKKLARESKQIIKEEKQVVKAEKQVDKADNKVKKKNKKVVIGILMISSMVLVYYLYSIISYQVESYLSAKKIEELISCILTPFESNVSDDTRIEDMIASGLDPDAMNPDGSQSADAQDSTVHGILYQYSTLYERNNDMIGWISIADTVINYPVMQTPDDQEYYLKRDFDRNSDINGLPFMDTRNLVTSSDQNLIIYGHNMKNGSMFSSLLNYEKESFFKQHPFIAFDTIYEEGIYDIVAVFQTRVAYEDEEFFRYYGMTDLGNEEDFNYYMSQIRQLSYYDTGADAEYGDTLLTLSTCDRRISNGRFVVVAVKRN